MQLRAKGAPRAEVAAAARELSSMCRRGGASLVINDDLALALEVGAAGVHLGPQDVAVAEARRRSPPGFVIGGSAGDAARARALVEQGADYLGVGAIFEARPSKADASAPRGLEALREIAAASAVPVVAIGGVELEVAGSCVEAGASGVAVIRAAWGSGDPMEVEGRVRALRAAVDAGLAARSSRGR